MAYQLGPCDWLYFAEWQEGDHPRDQSGKFTGAVKSVARVAGGVAKAVLPGAAKAALFALGHADAGLTVLAASVAHELVHNLKQDDEDWRKKVGDALEVIHGEAKRSGLASRHVRAIWTARQSTKKMSKEEAIELLRTLANPKRSAKTRFLRTVVTIAGTLALPPGGLNAAKWLWNKWKERRKRRGGRKAWRKNAGQLVRDMRQVGRRQGLSRKKLRNLELFGRSIEQGSAKDRDIAAFVKKAAQQG